MEVLISGAASRAVFLDGAKPFYVNLDDPLNKWPIGNSSISQGIGERILFYSPDTKKITVETEREALLELLLETSKDSALRLFEIVLEYEEDADLAVDAALELDRLFTDERVVEHLTNYVYAVKIGQEIDSKNFKDFLCDVPRVQALIHDVLDVQTIIGQVRTAWNDAAVRHFADRHELAVAEKNVVESGCFKRVTEYLRDSSKRDAVVFDLNFSMRTIPRYRELLGSWLSRLDLKSKRETGSVEFDLEAVAREDSAFEVAEEDQTEFPAESDGVKYQKVKDQIAAIRYQLERKNISNAERFTKQLVDSQIAVDDEEYAAKTLCQLAQDAKRLGYDSLRLDWCLWATKIYAADPWPFAQSADAFMHLFRYDEAAEYFLLAEQKGDSAYAALGLARLAMAKGQLEDALQKFSDVVKRYDSEMAWIGKGDVQRKIGKLDDALTTYDDAASKFTENFLPLCRKACVLSDLGDLDKALSLYVDIAEKFNRPIEAVLGQAEVHRAAGRFSEALAIYESAIAEYPNQIGPVVGRANALQECGQNLDALEVFESAIKAFENDPFVHYGYANCLRDLGRFHKALDILEAAVSRFPYEAHLQNARASIFKEMGDYERALKAYDKNCATFPYDLRAMVERVQILKELERIDLAREAIEDVVTRYPDTPFALNAKASILSLSGRFDEAVALLPEAEPRTYQDWIGYHIRCMIFLRRGEVNRSISMLKSALNKNPFNRSRGYFQNVLAAAELKLGRVAEAHAAATSGTGAAGKIIRLQTSVALENRKEATTTFKELRKDPRSNVVHLAEEIAKRSRLVHAEPSHPDGWVAGRTTELVMALAAVA